MDQVSCASLSRIPKLTPLAFDLGRCAIRFAFDDFDAGEEVRGGLADEIKEHFGVKETGEVLAKVVCCSRPHSISIVTMSDHH